MNESPSTINVVEFTFGSSYPTLKKIEEKEDEIRDLHQKLLEKGKALHLGCDSKIQYLKFPKLKLYRINMWQKKFCILHLIAI